MRQTRIHPAAALQKFKVLAGRMEECTRDEHTATLLSALNQEGSTRFPILDLFPCIDTTNEFLTVHQETVTCCFDWRAVINRLTKSNFRITTTRSPALTAHPQQVYHQAAKALCCCCACVCVKSDAATRNLSCLSFSRLCRSLLTCSDRITMSASASSTAAGAGALSNAHSLLQGAPSRFVLLQRQRANLDTFLRSHAASFAALRYEPWTTPSTQPAPAVTIRASSLSPAHLGVYPAETRRFVVSSKSSDCCLRAAATVPLLTAHFSSDACVCVCVCAAEVATWQHIIPAYSCRSS